MAVVSNYTIQDTQLNAYSSSIGGSAATAYVNVPYRCKVLEVGVVPYGAITSADCTIATTITGTAITGGSITLAVATAAAGTGASATPTGANIAQKGDYISFPPTGASGSNIAANFYAIIRRI